MCCVKGRALISGDGTVVFERFGDGLVGAAGGSREPRDDDDGDDDDDDGGGGGGDACAVCMETISVVVAVAGQQGHMFILFHLIALFRISYFVFRSLSTPRLKKAFELGRVHVCMRVCTRGGSCLLRLYSQPSAARSLNRHAHTHS